MAKKVLIEGGYYEKEGNFLSRAVAGVKSSLTGGGLVVVSKGKEAEKTPVVRAVEFVANNPGIVASGVAVGTAVSTYGLSKGIAQAVSKKALIGQAVIPAVGSIVAKTGFEKSANVVINAPSDVANFAGNVVGLAQDPSLKNFGDTFKENPALAGGATAILAYLAGRGGAAAYNAFENAQTRDAVNDVLDVVKDNTPSSPPSSPPPSPPPSDTPLPTPTSNNGNTGAVVPVTPATTTIPANKTPTSGKRRAKARSPTPQNTINLRIYNQTRSQTNKFIKMIR